MKQTVYHSFRQPLRENGNGGSMPNITPIVAGAETEVMTRAQAQAQQQAQASTFDVKSFFNTLLSNPVKAFKDQPIATIIVGLVLLKLLKVI